jgi:hypothetical protein
MGGSYRTLCVRMCDGYYWPISSTASRRDFGRDAKLCKSGCSSEARLFFQGKAEADAATMVDLSGRVYARLPTAFKYRKSISSDCACKPAPWSPSEIDRHRSYAALRASTTADVAGEPTGFAPGVEVVAGAATRPVAAQSDRTVSAETPADVASESGEAVAAATVAATADATGEKKTDGGLVPRQEVQSIETSRTPTVSIAPTRGLASITPAAARKARAQKIPTKVEARAPTYPKRLATAQKPSTPPYGLGGGKLKWPGD